MFIPPAFCIVFLLSITSAYDECIEVVVTNKVGRLTSPNYPAQYYPNTCTLWTFKKSFGDVVSISFTLLDLPKDPATGHCGSNRIVIQQYGYEQVICGHEAKPVSSSMGDTTFNVRFIAGPYPSGRGFRMSYTVGPRYSPWCGPDQYHCRNGQCIPKTWCCNGHRECVDGDDEFGCYDGQKPNSHFAHTHGQTTISPHRETTISSTRQTTISPSQPEAALNNCFQVLHNRTGHLQLNEAAAGKGARRCVWLIDVRGTVDKIVLRFHQISIPRDATVTVYKGMAAIASNELERLSYRRLVQTVTTTASTMLVEYRLDPDPLVDDAVQSTGPLVISADYTAYRMNGNEFPNVLPSPSEGHSVLTGMCELYGTIHCGNEDRCYRQFQRCDGVWDCPLSGADEAGCYGCSEFSFNCNEFGDKNAQCYSKRDRCSGSSVCTNGADESNCNEQLCSDARNLFLCTNKRCILYDFICDGTNDCGDNSDENGCSLESSRKVIVAAVVGSLLCSLLLVVSLGCACKFYYLRHNQQHSQHHHHRSPRYDTPLSRLQAEMFRRRAPPPPYHEAMVTSRPYDEAVREYLAQAQQNQQHHSTEQESRNTEASDTVSIATQSEDRSVQNLINLMDFSEEAGRHHPIAREDLCQQVVASDTSSDSDSDMDANTNVAMDEAGHIEMLENLGRQRSVFSPQGTNDDDDDDLVEIVSEDSASATMSADGIETLSPSDELDKDPHPQNQESSDPVEQGDEDDDKDDSDSGSVCILCLDEDPAALDDGTDTRCLLEDA